MGALRLLVGPILLSIILIHHCSQENVYHHEDEPGIGEPFAFGAESNRFGNLGRWSGERKPRMQSSQAHKM